MMVRNGCYESEDVNRTALYRRPLFFLQHVTRVAKETTSFGLLRESVHDPVFGNALPSTSIQTSQTWQNVRKGEYDLIWYRAMSMD